MNYFIWEQGRAHRPHHGGAHGPHRGRRRGAHPQRPARLPRVLGEELRALKEAGAQVGYDITQLARLNYRNHRKITVVDAEIGHSGGFNIGQEYIDGGKKYPAWRDTGIRMTGPAVADLEKLFDMRWYEVFGEDLFERVVLP